MIRMRLSETLVNNVLEDLRTPHSFAAERIGFLCCRQRSVPSGVLLLGCKYEPIRDDQYIQDDAVGARFDSSAIRSGMQLH